MLKPILLIVWALVVLNLLVSLPTAIVWPLHAIGVFLVVAHIAEFLIFYKRIKAKGDGFVKSFINTLLFGMVYIKNLK